MTYQKSIFLLFYIFSHLFCSGQIYEPGTTYSGTNDYVRYQAGNLPLIISVPHGGAQKPASIPDRSCSGCVVINDSYTMELGIAVKEAIYDLTGCYAHLVINDLHRSKMDANRDIVEAARGNEEAEKAWKEYHAFLDSANLAAIREWDRGLVIDLHGHGHDIQRLEIGYRISSSELRMTDSELDNSDISDESSIRTLVDSSSLSLSEIIRGNSSLGDLLHVRGFDAVPSSYIPDPASGEPYFQGGYITDRYGSKSGDETDAIQIECNRDVRFDQTERNRFADTLGVQLINFLQIHYFADLPNSYCISTNANHTEKVEEFRIHPNPSCYQIKLSRNFLSGEIQIFNSIGKKIYTRTIAGDLLNLPGLNNGLYFVRFQDLKGRVAVEKLIVQCQ
ncbi:MAG: T9SS type A sorting domain-containing protein [Bacteroidia bacterium]|nr:T9SS type A sorting domain-containing protein [Bacteroidia bacterium]